jgi:hypothetical protein
MLNKAPTWKEQEKIMLLYELFSAIDSRAGLITKLIQQDGEYTAQNQASLLNKELATISEVN